MLFLFTTPLKKERLAVTLQSLLKIHPSAGVIVSGDRNDLDVSAILSIDPSLRQTVRHPTRGVKVLDIIATNLSRYYSEPIIVPPLHPDTPGQGAPSDHNGVVAIPHNNTSHTHRTKTTMNIRPLPESLLQVFEMNLKEQDFNLNSDLSADEMVHRYEKVTNELLGVTFPEKRIVFNPDDKPWFTQQLRALKRARMREYNKHGRSGKYLELLSAFNEKFRTEYCKYMNKMKLEVTEGTRGSIYPVIKKLARRPGDTPHMDSQLPGHVALNLSPAQSAELVAEHFSKISMELLPLDITKLPPNVQTFLHKDDSSVAPMLTVNEVHSRIRKAKKPRGLVSGDLPRKVVQRCAAVLSVPITTVFNQITRFAQFPKRWKIEHQIAIPKVYPPENEDDLRNIAKTPFVSKVYESFIGGWLLPVVKPYLDPGQCGLKGLSITHYLIKLLNFVHKTLDLRKPHAVLAACVDMSKAFNRVDHTLVIEDLYNMKTPAWLLKILFSYLSNRSMYLTYNGKRSSFKMLPGGGPQGAYLGGIIFIIKFNGAFLRPPIPRPLNGPISGAKAMKVKFVDDGTVAVSVDLKASLMEDNSTRPKPLNFHERTGHILPKEHNLLQYYLYDTELFAKKNNMVINKEKTKVISFTKSKKWDFPPELEFFDGTRVENISEAMLLGVIVNSDLKWDKNTSYICEKARKRIWILRRLMEFKLSTQEMFDVYIKEIRSVLELAVPVWHPGLTKSQITKIENIQKLAFKIILQKHYINYQQACIQLSALTLAERRENLCLKFAKKNLKSENSFFTKLEPNSNTRNPRNIVQNPKCNFRRYENSSIPYLARILNQNQKNLK